MMVEVKVTAVLGVARGTAAGASAGGAARYACSEVWWAAAKARGASPYRPNKTPL